MPDLPFPSWFLALLLAITLLSSLDEFFIDLVYLVRVLPLTRRSSTCHPHYTEEALTAITERPIAVMIPAWDESDVIGRMVETNVRTLRYSNYQIFIGTYPNDPATRRVVDQLCSQFPQVQQVVCPFDGPNSKAHCLNAVYQEIRRREDQTGRRFEIFVQHDSEDVIHPMSFHVFNVQLTEVEMVQLPVRSLDKRWQKWTACHYSDEFQEHHAKTLPVRQFLTGSVPGAGVGTAYSRQVLEDMSRRSDGMLFNTGSLTEDYDFAIRLALAGFRIRFLAPRLLKSELPGCQELICTKAHFPDKFRASIRQKSRWILGIVLQGSQQIGWRGGFWFRYMLLRDRKGLVTSFVGPLSNVITVVYLTSGPFRFEFDPANLQWLAALTWIFAAERVAVRMLCVFQGYGFVPALFAFPRIFLANLIAICALVRAIWRWLPSLFGKQQLHWDKTAHVFPELADLPLARRLGELLMGRNRLKPTQLNLALERQRNDARPLGEILIDLGFVERRDVSQALAEQGRGSASGD